METGRKKIRKRSLRTHVGTIPPDQLLASAFRRHNKHDFEMALIRGANPNLSSTFISGEHPPVPPAVYLASEPMAKSAEIYEFYKFAFEQLCKYGLNLDQLVSKSTNVRDVLIHFAEEVTKSRLNCDKNMRDYAEWLLEKLSV